MRYGLTIVYVTARKEPKIEWFFDSLVRQVMEGEDIRVIVVDSFRGDERYAHANHVYPKPTIWQGEHRITSCDWWAKSNALNTGIALCQTDWICFLDDRSVLCAGWLQAIRRAMDGDFAICGSYEKHSHLKVENGVIVDPGETLGVDHRQPQDRPVATKDWYGGHGALPLEWCLNVNGFSEDICDGLSSEDSMFGLTLYNSGFPIMYDGRMKIVEDRTPEEITDVMKRADKGVPGEGDKSHAIVARFQNSRTSMNSYNLRELREKVLAGEPFPLPSASHFDWFDNQPISEMT